MPCLAKNSLAVGHISNFIAWVLSVLFVVIVGVGRWNMWTSEEVSPITQLILFPGLPGIFLLVGCYLGWRLWKRLWGPRVVKDRRGG